MGLIVILEDNCAMGEAEVLALRQAGFNALYASTVPEVVLICQDSKVDLILTEHTVGNITGLEVVNKLAHSLPHTPVAVCSEHTREEAMPLALATRGWLVKSKHYLQELPGYVQGLLDCLTTKEKLKEKKQLLHRQQAQNELAQWLSHNFKNILSASMGYLNLIDFKSTNQDHAQWEKYLNESRKSQEHAITLLEQLIRLTDSKPGEPESLIVAEVVDKAWEVVKAKVLLQTTQQFPERLPDTQETLEYLVFLNSTQAMDQVQMSLSDLSSILEALLQNALEAVLDENEPRILVHGEIRDGNLEITVRDNGRGMNASVSRRVLEPFFSTKGSVGVGLSLSLVNSLVVRQGGEVSLKSAPEVGTTFKISLPQLEESSPSNLG